LAEALPALVLIALLERSTPIMATSLLKMVQLFLGGKGIPSEWQELPSLE